MTMRRAFQIAGALLVLASVLIFVEWHREHVNAAEFRKRQAQAAAKVDPAQQSTQQSTQEPAQLPTHRNVKAPEPIFTYLELHALQRMCRKHPNVSYAGDGSFTLDCETGEVKSGKFSIGKFPFTKKLVQTDN